MCIRDRAEGLQVHPERMRANLALTHGAIVAERLTVALAPVLGKARAKQLLGEVTSAVARSGGELAEALGGHPLVAAHLSADALADLLDPARYLGAAGELVDREPVSYTHL